ncbi:MAG TPA: Clp protease N-terminal domain-containing protein [Candidatus Binatia bacterium]|nr:Clp protease N-terminal domain-containing protein [Candidatus Binatia bacterium]
MFSRFSPAARRVLRAAEQECRNHNHYYVGAEHMLFALLEEHDPDVEARLTALAVDVSDVHANVKRALGTGEDRMWEGILVTPRVRKIVKIAEERAGETLIQPVDLLDAIRSEGGGMAAEILARAEGGTKWAV